MSAFQRLLAEEATKPGSTMEEFKKTAFLLKDVAAGGVRLGHIHQLLAAAYGYKTLAALQAATVDGKFERKTDAKVCSPHPARQG